MINGFSSIQLDYAIHISQAISIHRREHNFPTVLGFSWSKIPACKINFSFLNFVLPFSTFFSSKSFKGRRVNTLKMWGSGLEHPSGGLHVFCLTGFSSLLVQMSIWICPYYLWYPDPAGTSMCLYSSRIWLHWSQFTFRGKEKEQPWQYTGIKARLCMGKLLTNLISL